MNIDPQSQIIYNNIMILLNMIMEIIWKDIKIMQNHKDRKLFLKELQDGSQDSKYQQGTR